MIPKHVKIEINPLHAENKITLDITVYSIEQSVYINTMYKVIFRGNGSADGINDYIASIDADDYIKYLAFDHPNKELRDIFQNPRNYDIDIYIGGFYTNGPIYLESLTDDIIKLYKDIIDLIRRNNQ